MTHFARALILVLLAYPALAEETGQLLYSRDRIAIRHIGGEPLPWQPKDQPASLPPLAFDVELRDAQSLYTRNRQGWFDLSSPSENSGLLLAFAAPSLSPIMRGAQYAPLDILFIDKEGRITQIFPDLVLSSLEEEIYPDAPVLAFLFLKGGMCKKLSIAPGDEVEYKIFKKPPVMLTAPPPVAPAAGDAVPIPLR